MNILRRVLAKAKRIFLAVCSSIPGTFRLLRSPAGILVRQPGDPRIRFLDPGSASNIQVLLSALHTTIQQSGGFSHLSVGTQNAQTRDTWIESVLKALPAGTRLLDAGAGEMQYKKFCAHLDYVSQDLSAYDGSGNASGLQTGSWNTHGIDIVSDICNMPVPDASFDAVLCTEVLEHVTDPVKALRELARVLRPGGRIILTAPFCSLTHFAPYHYSTGFNQYFYQHHLTELGFKDIRIVENGNYFEFLAQELRRLPWMAKQYAATELRQETAFASDMVLTELERLTKIDTGSQELLHFDCQVTATKI